MGKEGGQDLSIFPITELAWRTTLALVSSPSIASGVWGPPLGGPHSVTSSWCLEVAAWHVACPEWPPVPCRGASLLISAKQTTQTFLGPRLFWTHFPSIQIWCRHPWKGAWKKYLKLFLKSEISCKEELTSLTSTPACQPAFVFQKEKGNCPEGSRGE